MNCILKFSFLFCAIPFIKSVSLKIDGLINLGENWSYEYRVLRSGAQRSHHHKDSNASRHKEEEQLRMLEDRLRKEAVEHRKEVHQKDVGHNKKKQKNKGSEEPAVHKKKQVKKHKTKASSSSDESSSSDSDSKIKKRATMMIYDETTKKTKKILRFISGERDYSDSIDSQDSSASSGSWRDKTRHATPDDDAKSGSHDSNINIINHYVNPRAPRGISSKILETTLNKTIESISSIFNTTVPTLSTSTQVTTVRTENIFTNPHKVKDDAKIIEFTNHLYKQTMKVFDTVKQKTNQDHLKKQVDRLARSYEHKFKEFLRDTGSQKIKTRLGTQKVILNTIDMSNRILRRLMNFMIGDLDKKGVLRHNAASANIFQKAIELEQKLQLGRACKKFGICRSGPGFSAFLIDVLTILLKCDNKQFKQSIDAFTEVVKNMNFHKILEPHTDKKLKRFIEKVERQDTPILRAIVLILKNTITNQNKPMVVNNFSARQRIVNSTLALLEIIDLIDTKIPRNESNALEWADMKKSFEEFQSGKRLDILEIMTAMVKHVKTNLKSLDDESQRIVSKNLDMILTLELG